MSRNLTTQDISWFLDLKEKGQLNLNPPYQRRSVWSPNDKRFFVDTIFNNYPAPPVFLHKTMDDNGRPTYHVVDGKTALGDHNRFYPESSLHSRELYRCKPTTKKMERLGANNKRTILELHAHCRNAKRR